MHSLQIPQKAPKTSNFIQLYKNPYPERLCVGGTVLEGRWFYPQTRGPLDQKEPLCRAPLTILKRERKPMHTLQISKKALKTSKFVQF